VFGNKVFSRKGNFLARDVDPPIGDFADSPVSEPLSQPCVAEPSAEPDTSFYEACNVRVRVLKPDAVFIREVAQRLARLDNSVRKLNDKKPTES